MVKDILYINGDATRPEGQGNRIIVHVCNDIGGWGKGFVTALSQRWKAPEQAYRQWFKGKDGFELGAVQLVKVADDIWVANLIGQRKIYKDANGNPPVRYEAIARGLQELAILTENMQATVHMPRIGCGLAGGTWDKIEPLINNALCAKGIQVTVYDYDGS